MRDSSSRNRIIAIIIILITSIVIGGLVGFYFYTKNKTSTPTTNVAKNRTNFGGYNPDIDTNTSSQNSTDGDLNLPTKTATTTPQIPKLRLISESPTAGSDFITIPVYEVIPVVKNVEPADSSINLTASTSNGTVKKNTAPTKKPKIIGYRQVIRYIERGTGHIFDTATNTLAKEKISNQTEPKIYEALFVNQGNDLILRGLVGDSDMISTRYASIIKSTTTEASEGLSTSLDLKDLPIDLTSVSVSPDKTQLFSISNTGTRGLLSKVDGGSIVGIYDTPYREWISSWPSAKTITLTTKASGFAPGFLYNLNPTTQEVIRVLGNIYGLTTLTSPDTTKVVFSKSEQGSIGLYLLDTKSRSVFTFPFKTLPEKCVWAKQEKNTLYCALPDNIAFGTYPDIWYQGQINFADSVWKINLDTGETRLVMSIQKESGQVIDATNLSISPTDDYLVFTNKIDLTLWGLQLVEPVILDTTNPLDTLNRASSSVASSTTR